MRLRASGSKSESGKPPPRRRPRSAGLFICIITAALLTFAACGAPASPEQQTVEAVAEQTKTWEKAKDKARGGWGEEELISGEHCKYIDDDVHPSYQMAEQIKAEIEHPETFEATLGKKAQEDFDHDFFVYSLSGADVKKFDIPLSEQQIRDIKFGATVFNPLNKESRFGLQSEYPDVWADRPRHEARLDFYVDSDPDQRFSRYAFYRAFGFVDHWTCEAKLLRIERRSS